jgi:iron complex outermembrane receptor protein
VDPEFFDIDRIEVLRGPQGTLYGRNSVGGSVNVITRHPTPELGGHVDACSATTTPTTCAAGPTCRSSTTATPRCWRADRRVGRARRLPGEPLQWSGATHDADGQDFWMARGQLYFKFSSAIDFLLIASASENKDPWPPRPSGI